MESKSAPSQGGAGAPRFSAGMRPRRRRPEFERVLRRRALTSKLVAPPHGVEECAVAGRSRGPALQRGDATPETATGIRACSTPSRVDTKLVAPPHGVEEFRVVLRLLDLVDQELGRF